MKNGNYFFRIVLLFLALSLCRIAQAQTAQAKPTAKDSSTVRKVKRPDYSFLKNFPERNTKVTGEVNKTSEPKYTQLYPKDGLFADSFHIINTGAKFELLNDSLPLSKNFNRILVKITSNPPDNNYAGETGWILIDHTSLFPYLDHSTNKVDMDFYVKKYSKAAEKCRADAAQTTCAANKKCNLEWAKYFDCMAKEYSPSSTPKCTLPNCAMQDCPGDNK